MGRLSPRGEAQPGRDPSAPSRTCPSPQEGPLPAQPPGTSEARGAQGALAGWREFRAVGAPVHAFLPRAGAAPGGEREAAGLPGPARRRTTPPGPPGVLRRVSAGLLRDLLHRARRVRSPAPTRPAHAGSAAQVHVSVSAALPSGAPRTRRPQTATAAAGGGGRGAPLDPRPADTSEAAAPPQVRTLPSPPSPPSRPPQLPPAVSGGSAA